jgi:hypothetical protein
MNKVQFHLDDFNPITGECTIQLMDRFYCSAREAITKPSNLTEVGLKFIDNLLILYINGKEIHIAEDIICNKRINENILNTTPNVEGFNRRMNEGRKGGKNFVEQLKAASFKYFDTLDIVCHSMGFAYALGMIEEIKMRMPDIRLGGFYIIAPENACSGAVNVNDWEQVWQYGSDEKNTSVHKQDGVAPQCAVKNIGINRAYIPDNVVQGFISSHSIENYKWIFTRTINDKGYVTPRK